MRGDACVRGREDVGVLARPRLRWRGVPDIERWSASDLTGRFHRRDRLVSVGDTAIDSGGGREEGDACPVMSIPRPAQWRAMTPSNAACLSAVGVFDLPRWSSSRAPARRKRFKTMAMPRRAPSCSRQLQGHNTLLIITTLNVKRGTYSVSRLSFKAAIRTRVPTTR